APTGVDSENWKSLARSWKGNHELLPVFVKEKIYDQYYNGFCNDLLWPLLHYESNRTIYRDSDWQAYIKVNQLFANQIIETASKNELIWINDFHLFLSPKMIKEKRPDLKVGFFLHIPFPSSEIFRQLPHREEVLKSLLAADLIGFHDYSYLQHFTSSLMRILGVQPSFFSIQYAGHTTRLGVFPVSIDTEKLYRTSD